MASRVTFSTWHHAHQYGKDCNVINDARNEFAAPLGSATTGRLEFVRGAYNATIHADALATDLYRACFEGTAPDVRAEDGTVRVESPDLEPPRLARAFRRGQRRSPRGLFLA